jgi:GT2 family glycosyltransferase
MNMFPKISVVIITYNRAALLPRAVESVLAQSYRDFELLIIDDASIDETEKVARSLAARDERVKYFKNEFNLDISKSRNHGVALAQGEYVAMLDSDDYWLDKDKLKKQVAYLEEHPEVGVIGTAIRCEDEHGQLLKEDIYAVDDREIRARMLWKNQIAQSSVLFRKEAYVSSGAYDESLRIGEDYDLWLKIGRRWKFANLPQVMVAYLIHSGGRSKEKVFKTISATDRIIRRHKKNYPGYFKARVKSGLRFLKALI